MKRYLALFAALMLCLGATVPAHAMQAMLVSCNPGQSAGGKYGFIGTYRLLNGNTVRYFFELSCPSFIEVD